MPECVIYGDKQGYGYISDNPEIDLPLIMQPVTVVDEIIQPGAMTDVKGYFCRPLLFVGLVDKTELLFYIGKTGDLFETKHYWQSLWVVSPTRLYHIFGPGFGRDFNWVNGKWK